MVPSMQPTLVVLAAGIGSRYGGLKQMDPVGPGGAFILDYSAYDAILCPPVSRARPIAGNRGARGTPCCPAGTRCRDRLR